MAHGAGRAKWRPLIVCLAESVVDDPQDCWIKSETTVGSEDLDVFAEFAWFIDAEVPANDAIGPGVDRS